MTASPAAPIFGSVQWGGVFAAVPTQFGDDETLDLDALERQIARLVDAGVAAVVVLAPLGENASLSDDEKRAVLHRAVLAAGGHVPVLAAACEHTTRAACRFAVDCERIGADALVVLPSPRYRSRARETLMHLRSVAASSELPVMVHDHPAELGADELPAILGELGELENVEAVAECAADPGRVPRLVDAVGPRLRVFAAVDDLVVESVLHGARGWLAGIVNVFPHEAVGLFELAIAGRWGDALALRRWLAPLQRVVADTSPVQAVKLAQELLGAGSEAVRAPRLPLDGAERALVERTVREALERRPALEAVV
jgi:1-pyrroline-4-hydroxy-2-carboxylate deaminase